ncbi:MAG: hypothetical protein ABH811_02665 [archaeon]
MNIEEELVGILDGKRIIERCPCNSSSNYKIFILPPEGRYVPHFVRKTGKRELKPLY